MAFRGPPFHRESGKAAQRRRRALSRASRVPTFDGSGAATIARPGGSDYHLRARPLRGRDVRSKEHSVMQQDLMPGLARGAPRAGQIKLHGPDAFEGMRKAGALAAATLDFITPYIAPGVTTG